jgi:hypothetical protein
MFSQSQILGLPDPDFSLDFCANPSDTLCQPHQGDSRNTQAKIPTQATAQQNALDSTPQICNGHRMKTKQDQIEAAKRTGQPPKHAGGRPSKYTPELLQRARKYVDGAWQTEAGDVVPMECSLAEFCGISEKTLYEWKLDPDKSQFGEICARVFAMQKKWLINGGLNRSYDSGLAKLLLMKHGYSDRAEIDHTTKGERINRVSKEDQAELIDRIKSELGGQ